MRILNKKTFKRPRHWLAFSISPFFITSVCAQGVATEKSLEPVVVTGTRSPLDPNLPTTTESRTAAQLREQN
ncbi:MAG: hypothetical protein ACREX0_15495, partial [Noviherbaspirillum sp.]